MGLINRFSNLVRANVNALLEKFEDPETIMRDSIQRMERDFGRCRERVGQLMAEAKVTVKRKEFHLKKVEEWMDKARLALKMEKEDLAREALARKEAEAQRADQCASLLLEQETVSEEAKDALVDLKERVAKAREELGAWVARQRHAKTRLLRARRRAEGKAPKNGDTGVVAGRVAVHSDAIEEFERIVRRIEETECLADAQEEISRDVSLPDYPGPSAYAGEEILPRQYSPEVELELEKLKEEIAEEPAKVG